MNKKGYKRVGNKVVTYGMSKQSTYGFIAENKHFIAINMPSYDRIDIYRKNYDFEASHASIYYMNDVQIWLYSNPDEFNEISKLVSKILKMR